VNFVVALLAAGGAFLVFDGLTGGPRAPRRASSATKKLLEEAGLRSIGASRFVLGCSAGASLMLFLVAGLTGSLIVALALAVPVGWTPVAYARSRRRKRRERSRDAWPDAIASLVASVRAGIALSEACASLATRGPEHLRSGFIAFRGVYRSQGSFASAISELRKVLADPIADRVCAALLIAQEVGGSDLVRTLRALSDFVRDDLRIRREIQARWSWTVTAARVAAAAPWLVLVMMASRPEAARAYNSGAGVVVLIAGAAATLIGYRLMLRAARLPEHRRLEP
jgi:tight adherence protein B